MLRQGMLFHPKGEKASIHGDFQSMLGNDQNLGFRLFTSDLSNIRSALVSLLGWKLPSRIPSSPAMLGFSSISSKRQRTIWWLNRETGSGADEAGFGEFLRLLVVQALPVPRKTENLFLIEGFGCGWSTYDTFMLENLLRQTLPSKSYHGKSIFQILRLMSDLVKEPRWRCFRRSNDYDSFYCDHRPRIRTGTSVTVGLIPSESGVIVGDGCTILTQFSKVRLLGQRRSSRPFHRLWEEIPSICPLTEYSFRYNHRR